MARRTRRTTRSRLARQEKKKLTRQTIGFIFLTIFLIFGLIFWGIPALIKMAIFIGNLRGSSRPVEQSSDIPPPPPQLSPLTEATRSGSLTIAGFAQEGLTIELYRNDAKAEEVLVDESGSFKFTSVRLIEGDNEFYVKAVNDKGTASQPSIRQIVVYDTTPPELSIDKPHGGEEFSGGNNKTIVVEGKSEAEVNIYVNDRYVAVDSEGKFSTRITLTDGDNVIKVKAVDDAGNETSREVAVKYSP